MALSFSLSFSFLCLIRDWPEMHPSCITELHWDKHKTRTLYPHRCAGLMFGAKLWLFVSKLRLLLESLDGFCWAASSWLCCREPLAFLSSLMVGRTHKKRFRTTWRQTQVREQLSSEKAKMTKSLDKKKKCLRCLKRNECLSVHHVNWAVPRLKKKNWKKMI